MISYLSVSVYTLGTSWGITKKGLSELDTFEIYELYLNLKDTEKVKICNISGEGSKVTGWFGFLFSGDSFIDFVGDQGEVAGKLLHLLSEKLSINIGGKTELDIEYVNCRSCGHKLVPQAIKCIYCGASADDAQPVAGGDATRWRS